MAKENTLEKKKSRKTHKLNSVHRLAHSSLNFANFVRWKNVSPFLRTSLATLQSLAHFSLNFVNTV
jgi:hypothetical protein